MKTTGVSCETKFGLLVFLGHPTGDALFLPSGCMQHRERRRLGCVLEDADKGPVEAQLPPPAHHWHCRQRPLQQRQARALMWQTPLSLLCLLCAWQASLCLLPSFCSDKCALYNSNLAILAGSKCCKLEHAD